MSIIFKYILVFLFFPMLALGFAWFEGLSPPVVFESLSNFSLLSLFLFGASLAASVFLLPFCFDMGFYENIAKANEERIKRRIEKLEAEASALFHQADLDSEKAKKLLEEGENKERELQEKFDEALESEKAKMDERVKLFEEEADFFFERSEKRSHTNQNLWMQNRMLKAEIKALKNMLTENTELSKDFIFTQIAQKKENERQRIQKIKGQKNLNR
ncbi:hypothetical protein [Piscirickettsia litoralis]|uniref:Uncharacterized protein n=1 Tax=Piscirickettsia litoralis TaxID=1891921 RepID=A0ABX3A037_9GAMM|nr:hypothetical protein [Piscirickettsia litoralis]ODN40988.1 hypothetical protein BGC07_18710 [Piscirickettsia litoralis]